MQRAEPLNKNWAAVSAAIPCADDLGIDQLVAAMTLVASACAHELRQNPPTPLTASEQQILDDERADDPRFYELMIQADESSATPYVLEWFDKTMQLATEFANSETPDRQQLADGSVMCWDHIVPEYFNHQLAHLAALIGSQLIGAFPEFHTRTWLFRISNAERWALFLGLAQEVDLLNASQIEKLASSLSAEAAGW